MHSVGHPAGSPRAAWPAELGGELNIPLATERLPELQALARACPPGTCCELDAAGITECDSAGVQLLLALRRSLAHRGSTLRLRGLRGALAQALATYRLDEQLAPRDLAASLVDELGEQGEPAAPGVSAAPAPAPVPAQPAGAAQAATATIAATAITDPAGALS
jgi:ABC-type transporter Mla MlaB component